MYRLLLFLAPAVLLAGEARYARLGEIDGKVEVQLHAADPWSRAERNLPLTENAWLRTADASRLEVELDEGSALRLGPNSLVELSDYARLSTGQRLTVLSLDHGVAWFTGEPAGFDSLSLAVPGAQITLAHGARIRIEAANTFSNVTVIEGVVRLASPSAELDIRQGQTARVEPGNPSPFSLEREVVPMELDRWSEERDKLLAAPLSAAHVTLSYGLADLDAAGDWLQTELGPLWKPRVSAAWTPFQLGRWRWYDTLGYTWVSDETWGWLPYHYGRWLHAQDQGWVWSPPSNQVFKPGDVYWLWGRQLAGWGPLAPGENWIPPAPPQQFQDGNITYAAFTQGVRVIDPAGFAARPATPLSAAVLALALPSPPLLPSRLEARRPMLRVGATRAIAPVVPGTVFDADAMAPPPPEIPPAVVTDPASDAPPPPPIGPLGIPPVVPPVPIYTDIVVINPPQHPDYGRRNPNNPPPPPQVPVVRGSGQSQPPTGRPSQPANNPPPAATPTPTPTPPIAVPPRIEQPHVGAPAPQRTDRPRVESPPPPRVDPPRSQPRESTPAPTPAPARVEQPRSQPREAAPAPTPAPARVEQPRSQPSAPAPTPKVEPAKADPAKTDPPARKQ